METSNLCLAIVSEEVAAPHAKPNRDGWQIGRYWHGLPHTQNGYKSLAVKNIASFLKFWRYIYIYIYLVAGNK